METMNMGIPNQLKKSNKCDIGNIMEKADDEDEFKTKESAIAREIKDCFTFFEIFNKKGLILDDLFDLNLINVYKDIQIIEMQVIENFIKNDKFIRNSLIITKELSESEILLEFGKKMQDQNKNKKNDEIIFYKLTQMVHILGILLFLNIYFFNEQRFESELRALGSIIRNILPFMCAESIKLSSVESFLEVFYHCLGSVKIIVNIDKVQEMCSMQVVINLINVFSIEEINAKIILLVIDIIVHLFVSNSINSSIFMENTLSSVFNAMEEIPKSLKSLKRARICVDLDFSMHYYVYLIIRIIQGICIPNGITLSNDFYSNKQNSMKYHNLARSICNQFSTFFINKLIFNRVKNKDYHYSIGNDIAVVIFSDLLKASLNPKYYICSTITNVILIQLIKISNSFLSNNSNSKINLAYIDTYSKELCIYLLGVSLTTFLKSINYNISLNGLSDNNSGIEKIEYNNEIQNSSVKGEIDCICGNDSFNLDLGERLSCKTCDKVFHFNCINDNIQLEINEDWKCDDCVINVISNELYKNIADNNEMTPGSFNNSKICVVMIIILDYLYRKTGLSTSPTKYETAYQRNIITDVNSSIICSFILEMKSKLKLFNSIQTRGNEKLSNLKVEKNKNVDRKGSEEKGKLFIMLFKEWLYPVTNIHSSLITYSSKFPKLLDSCTIRIWNNYLLKEIKTLSNLVLHCLLANIYNSSLSTMRRIALNSLGQVISARPSLLFINSAILNAILLSLKDKTPKIRERALAIIEKYFSDIYSLKIFGDKYKFEDENKLLLDQIIRTTFDISPLVRLASIKILKILYSKNPTKLYIGSLLLKRALASDETQTIKRLSIDTFISLWFCDSSVINDEMGNSLVDIINYSESKDFNQSIGIEYIGCNSFIGYIQKIIRNNSDSKNAEDLISRWSKVFIDMFLNCENFDNSRKIKDESELKNNILFSEKRLNILKSIEIIGQIYPESIVEIYPHIIVYLKDFSIIKSDVIINICTVLSYVLPLVKDINTKSIEMDLLKIVMDSKSPQLIRSSILCLTSLLSDNSKENCVNDNNILIPIIMESIRNLWEYKHKIYTKIDSIEVKILDSIRRNAWLLGCIYEYSSPSIALTFLNNRIERAKIIETEFGISWVVCNDKSDSITDNGLGNDINVDYNVVDSSNLVFDLMCELFYLLDWNLNKSILFPTLIQFLMNQKQFIKTIKFNNLIKSALKGIRIQENDSNKIKISNSVNNEDLIGVNRSGLCIICLQGILSLLRNYESRAVKENKNNQCNGDLPNDNTTNIFEVQHSEYSTKLEENNGSKIYNTPNNRINKPFRNTDQLESCSPISTLTFENVENPSTVKTNIFGSASQNTTSSSASQPLASNLDILLSIFQETTAERDVRFNKVQKQQICSLILCILEQFNKHGLVNPTSIIPPISGLLFSTNREISYKSYQIICSIFDRFPNLIINKYKDITINGFIYYYSNIKNLLGVYKKEDSDFTLKCIFTNETTEENVQGKTRSELLGTTFEYFSRIYFEKCRGRRIYRESVIKGCCKQLELLLSADEVKGLLNKLSSNINLSDGALLILYTEFVSYLILALPFIYESELLLLLYNLGEMCVSCSQNCNNIHEMNEIVEDDAEMKIYSNSILAITCTSLQKVLKEEYKVNESHMSNFNPYNSINKEKPKYFHIDGEFQGNTNESVTNLISLNRSTIYEYMNSFRERLFNIWELYTKGSSEDLVKFVNEILYLNAHTTIEKVARPGKRKQTKRKSVKRSRNDDKYSDTCSSQSWSPTKR